MNALARLLLLAAAIALTAPAVSDAQTVIRSPPKGGLIPSGPYSMAPRGANGQVISGPGGSQVRGPNSGEIGRTPAAAPAATRPYGAGGVVHPAYGTPTGRAFYYGGRTYYGVYAPAFAYPPGWTYRRWAVGAVLPAVFLTKPYHYADYAALGLPHPAAGHQWVRYGPDLLMVDTRSGAVLHAAHGVFAEG